MRLYVFSKDIDGSTANRTEKEATTPNCSFVLTPEEGTELIEQSGSRLTFEGTDNLGEFHGRWIAEKKVDVVFLSVNLKDFAVDKLGNL